MSATPRVPSRTSASAGSSTVALSVIVPHYNDLKGLDRCLAGLAVQTFGKDRIEVIVSDNASPQGEPVVAELIAGRAQLVVCDERGAGPARNAGVAKSRGALLAFIDSDCLPDPHWLEEGVAALEAFDFVGGRVKVLVEDESAMTPAESFEAVFAFDFETYITKKNFTGAGNMLCRRSMFDQVGGFDKGVSEDVDWSHRATAAGFRLGYAPLAIVSHPARRTWSELKGKWARVNLETFKLHLKERRGSWRWLARCAALPFSAIAHTPKTLASDQLPRVQDRLSALGMLYRLRFWRAAHCFSLALQGDAAA